MLLAVPVLALSACGCAAYCALTWRRWLRRLGLPRSPLHQGPPCTRGQADGCAGDERGGETAAGPLPGRPAEGWAGIGLAWDASTGLWRERKAGGHGGERSRDARARLLPGRQAENCDRDGRGSKAGAGPRRWEQALGRVWQGRAWGGAGAAGGYAGDAVAPYVLHWAAATAVAALVLHVQVLPRASCRSSHAQLNIQKPCSNSTVVS